MTNSHADKHDRDKLARWHKGLSLNPPSNLRPQVDPNLSGDKVGPLQREARGDFPVYAVFLVSEAHRDAHGIFREFRTRFEARSAGFEHLVIFGQHGLSGTVLGLLDGFGLSLEALPALVVFASPSDTTVYTLPLAGAGEDAEGHWREALARVEDAADRGEKALDLASLPCSARLKFDDGTVVELVAELLRH